VVFYTYLWLRDDGTPYYAGKGSGKRAFRWHNRLLIPPSDPENILIQEWPDEAGAFEGEKLLIAIYGRKDNGTGCLRNLTDGGENPPKGARKGYKDSLKTRRQCRLRRLGVSLSVEARQKVQAYQKTHDNAGRFRKRHVPAVTAEQRGTPWNKGKQFRHEKSFKLGHKPYCNHFGGFKTSDVCSRCGKKKST